MAAGDARAGGGGITARTALAVAALWAACSTGAWAEGPAAADSRILVTLSGAITDSGSVPLRGIVRVYIEGRAVASTTADQDGNYSLDFRFDPGRDETVIVFWVSPRTDLVSDLAIVTESSRDRALGLWSPCIPRIGAQRRISRSVRLLDGWTFRSERKTQGCS